MNKGMPSLWVIQGRQYRKSISWARLVSGLAAKSMLPPVILFFPCTIKGWNEDTSKTSASLLYRYQTPGVSRDVKFCDAVERWTDPSLCVPALLGLLMHKARHGGGVTLALPFYKRSCRLLSSRCQEKIWCSPKYDVVLEWCCFF